MFWKEDPQKRIFEFPNISEETLKPKLLKNIREEMKIQYKYYSEK